jgi:hypothetical protein
MKPNLLRNLAENLHGLADVLGDHHDLVVLRWTALEYGETILGEDALKALVALIDQRRLELESQADRFAVRLYDQSDEDFVLGMRGYWQAWRTAGEFSLT